jgi:hypothetical protein
VGKKAFSRVGRPYKVIFFSARYRNNIIIISSPTLRCAFYEFANAWSLYQHKIETLQIEDRDVATVF